MLEVYILLNTVTLKLLTYTIAIFVDYLKMLLADIVTEDFWIFIIYWKPRQSILQRRDSGDWWENHSTFHM